jgi:hypothetical protein
MNAGILILEDGRPCFVCDQELPHPVAYLQYCREGSELSIVYATPNVEPRICGYPLDERFADLFQSMRRISIVVLRGGKVTLSIVPMVFAESAG